MKKYSIIVIFKYFFVSQENFGTITEPGNPIFPVSISLNCNKSQQNICDVINNPNVKQECKNYAYLLSMLKYEYQIDPNAIQAIWDDKFRDMCQSEFRDVCKKV